MKHQTAREAIAWLQTLPPYYTVETIVVHVEPEPTLPKTEHEQQLDLFGWPDHLPTKRRAADVQREHGERLQAREQHNVPWGRARACGADLSWDDPRLWQPGTYQNGA